MIQTGDDQGMNDCEQDLADQERVLLNHNVQHGDGWSLVLKFNQMQKIARIQLPTDSASTSEEPAHLVKSWL